MEAAIRRSSDRPARRAVTAAANKREEIHASFVVSARRAEAFLGLEQADDVSLKSPDGSVRVEQSKPTFRSNPISGWGRRPFGLKTGIISAVPRLFEFCPFGTKYVSAHQAGRVGFRTPRPSRRARRSPTRQCHIPSCRRPASGPVGGIGQDREMPCAPARTTRARHRRRRVAPPRHRG